MRSTASFAVVHHPVQGPAAINLADQRPATVVLAGVLPAMLMARTQYVSCDRVAVGFLAPTLAGEGMEEREMICYRLC